MIAKKGTSIIMVFKLVETAHFKNCMIEFSLSESWNFETYLMIELGIPNKYNGPASIINLSAKEKSPYNAGLIWEATYAFKKYSKIYPKKKMIKELNISL